MASDTTSAAHPTEVRPPIDEADLRYWLENMLCAHGYSAAEAANATGMSLAEVAAASQRLGLTGEAPPARAPLRVLPYPGGRHPRLGFLDGAVAPQRETKFSVFAPWAAREYAVVDLPEAIWWQEGLLYLAHDHDAAPPTPWRRQGLRLPRLEWTRHPDGRLSSCRRLPNGVAFGAEVRPRTAGVDMELWLENGSPEPLRDLRVQICVMLGRLSEFAEQTTANKLFRPPFAACRNAAGTRWLITAWEACQRAWGNERCPCLHADPQFPDCLPGARQVLYGRLSFFEGADIEAELRRQRPAPAGQAGGADPTPGSGAATPGPR